MRFVPLRVPQRASFDLARNPRTPPSLGYWLNSMGRVPTGTAIEAKSGCSRGEQQKEALHKPGVVSRVPRRSRSAEQARRTETLTGQAAHTSSGNAASGRQQDAMGRLERDRWELAQRRRIDCNWTAGHLRSGAYQCEAQCLARGASGTVRPERKARPPLLNFWFRYPRMRWFPANSNSSGPTLRGSCIG